MSFRLRHRATFSPSSITEALHLRLPRASAPAQWNWTWPLTPSPTPSSPSPPTHTWVSAVHTITVSDDASHIALVSHHDGRVALLSLTPQPTCLPLLLSIDNSPATATSVCFLSLSLPPASTPTTYVAVGYSTGLIALFSTLTHTPLFITRPSLSLPVRRLRLYPALQLDPLASPYPFPSSNAALLAVLGWGGTLAYLPLSELPPFLSAPIPPVVDLRGAGWTLWHATAQRAVLDAAACAADPSSICDLDLPPGDAPLRILCAGVAPALAAYSATNSPAFSARDAAKRAASSVFSAAKGFLFSRMAGDQPPVTQAEDARKAVTGVARFITSWADDAASSQGMLNLSDVTDSARKSVNAVLSRGRKSMDIDGVAASDSRRSRNSRGSFGSLQRDELLTAADAGVDERNSDSLLFRQRSRFAGEEVAQAAKLPQNARVVERITAAPLPCTLLATSDTLGRIFVQDSRDLCVLRVLKGYRNAQIAWLAEGGPLLAILAPRLNVLELHNPLDVKRICAFRLLPGSMLVQSAMHHVFCISPDGKLYELMRSRKGEGETTAGNQGEAYKGKETKAMADEQITNGVGNFDGAAKRNETRSQNGSPADYESVGAFLEAVKKGQTSAAVECLQKVEDDGHKVAHLMATLVTCASYTRTEVHVALSSKAAQVASNLKDRDLLSRFEAHGRLAEAFALVFADVLPHDSAAEENRVAKYGKRLMEDDIGTGLLEFAVDELKTSSSASRVGGKRMRSSKAEDDIVNCERFILSHALQPTTDLRAEVDFVLRARRDLSESEQIWLANVYFSRLLYVDSADFPTEGREHPATKDVFLALTEFVGLPEADLTQQFALFFLNMPLLPLLRTHVSTHASPIRCAIARLRTRFSSEIVDQILMEKCETSSRIPNAVLLTRLCVSHERRLSKGNDAPFMASLDRLEEVLLFRKFIAGSTIPRHVYEKFTARGCTGVPGDAERHAVVCLIEWNDFDRASKILTSLEESRRRQNLEWHESASVCEAALHVCRKKTGSLITESGRKVIPENVVTWILAVETDEDRPHWTRLISENREGVLRQMRAVLLSAHQYFSDSSVDAVRCLQLAEAMSALIELEVEAGISKTKSSEIAHQNADSVKVPDTGKESQSIASEEIAHENIMDDANPQVPVATEDSVDLNKTTPITPVESASPNVHILKAKNPELAHHNNSFDKVSDATNEPDAVDGAQSPSCTDVTLENTANGAKPKVPVVAEDCMNLDKAPPVPTLETAALDDDALDAVPTVPQDSDDMLQVPVVSEESSGMDVDDQIKVASDDDDIEMFFDASSRHRSESMAESDQNDVKMVAENADN